MSCLRVFRVCFLLLVRTLIPFYSQVNTSEGDYVHILFKTLGFLQTYASKSAFLGSWRTQLSGFEAFSAGNEPDERYIFNLTSVFGVLKRHEPRLLVK